MKINGKITEIITSRALVSFGGFVELEGKEFEDMKNIFTYLSKEYEFYCNHVVLKCICFNSVFYIGFNDNKICIGNEYHKLEHEDKRDIIPVNYRITQLHRKLAL